LQSIPAFRGIRVTVRRDAQHMVARRERGSRIRAHRGWADPRRGEMSDTMNDIEEPIDEVEAEAET
jgi:hypothetical protein